MIYRLSILLLLTGLPQTGWARSSYEVLARDLARIARKTGYTRVAVLPLQPASGGGAAGGRAIAERLLSRLAGEGGVELVERALLDQVLGEQRLGHQGWIDPAQARRVGRVLGVEGIVTGSFMTLRDGRIEVHARLLDAETARVVGAATSRVAREWEEDFFGGQEVLNVQPPDLRPSARSWSGLGSLRDAVAERACSRWEERVDRLQASTLDLKARHWAARLRAPGFSTRALTRNPGSEIRSLSARHEFYRRLKELHRGGASPGLTLRERELLAGADRAVEKLLEACY